MIRFLALFLLLLPAAAAFERPLVAQTRTAGTDTVRRPDSLAERQERDRTRQAQERLRQLLREASAYHVAGDRRMEGVSLRQAGNVYYSELNIPDSAHVLYRRARALARMVGNHWDELAAEFNIRSGQWSPAFSDSALAFWREALATMRRAGDRSTEGEVLLAISPYYQSFDSALTYAKQAAHIARELGDRWERGLGTFYTVGLMYLRHAQLDSAEVYLREHLERARANRDQTEEGWALNELASLNSMRGRFDSTMVLFHAALEQFRALGDRNAEITVLTNIGSLQVTIGRPDSGRFYLRQGLEHARKLANRFDEQFYLNGIGESWLAQNRADSALVYFREALRIAPQPGDRRTTAYTLWGLGQAQHAIGQTDSALATLRRSLALHREVGTRDGAAGVLGTIGTVHRDAGSRDSALANYGEGLALARAAEAPDPELTILGDLAELYHKQGPRELGTAVAYYDSAAAVRATIAARVGADPSKVSYAERSTQLYERWALAWLAREREVGREASQVAALAAAERGRAQALLELLRRGAVSDSAPPAQTGSTYALGSDLAQEGRDLAASIAAMGAPALVYMATKDTLLTWLVLPSGEVALERQAIARDSVAAFVAAIRGHLGADEAIGRTLRSIESRAAVPSGPGAPTTRARAMTSAERFETSASALIPPGLAARLPAGGELVIVPHGPLALVAFAALPIGSQPVGLGAREALGSRYAIRYAPSLTTLRVVTARAGATERAGTGTRVAALRGALVVGNPMMPRVRVARGGSVRLPALPAAGREGRWVAQALGVQSLTGRLATERAVRDRMAKAPVIHLATHGFAYSADARALDSFVALAPDSLAGAEGNGLLTVGEVIEDAPHLTADLVVLSACQTGLGNLRQAEGTVGLQRAFLAKGARSVLVSLWSVSDEATELLMRRFYTHWLHDTDEPSKAEALRRAQGDVRRTPKFSDPRFWAAFQLVGAR